MQMEQLVYFHSSLKTSGMRIAQKMDHRTDGSGVEPLQIMTQISYLDIVHWNVNNFIIKKSFAHLVLQCIDNTLYLSRTFPPKVISH